MFDLWDIVYVLLGALASGPFWVRRHISPVAIAERSLELAKLEQARERVMITTDQLVNARLDPTMDMGKSLCLYRYCGDAGDYISGYCKEHYPNRF